MIVIIDGYNLLKQIFPHVRGRLEPQRDIFIRQLGYYKYKKHDAIKDIIVVFDAGPFSHASREIKHGIAVIFSGQKSSADDWIIEYVQKHRNKELLVVTNDRKIISASENCNATTLGSNDFYRILQQVLLEGQNENSSHKIKLSSDIKKIEHDDYLDEDNNQITKIDEKTLDMIMEEASFDIHKKDEIPNPLVGNKSKSQSLSKKAKKLYSKLKKLH